MTAPYFTWLPCRHKTSLLFYHMRGCAPSINSWYKNERSLLTILSLDPYLWKRFRGLLKLSALLLAGPFKKCFRIVLCIERKASFPFAPSLCVPGHPFVVASTFLHSWHTSAAGWNAGKRLPMQRLFLNVVQRFTLCGHSQPLIAVLACLLAAGAATDWFISLSVLLLSGRLSCVQSSLQM